MEAEMALFSCSASWQGANQQDGPHLFSANFELHVRSLIAALEMTGVRIAQVRAQEILNRLDAMIGFDALRRDPLEIQMLKSALITFLGESQNGQPLPLRDADRDFSDYWWGILRKKFVLPESATAPLTTSRL